MALFILIIGFVAYSLIATLTGVYFLSKDKSEASNKTLALYVLTASILLLLTSIVWMITSTPESIFIVEFVLVLNLMLLSLVLLGFSFHLWMNLDIKIVGNSALIAFIFGLVSSILNVILNLNNLTINVMLLQINIVLYLLVEFGFWAYAYKKISAVLQSYLLLFSGLENFLLTLYFGVF